MAELVKRDGSKPAEKKTPTKQAAEKKAPVEKKTTDTRKVKDPKPTGSATGKRVGAIILWVLAIAFEIVSLMILFGKINVAATADTNMIIGFVALALDLVCVIIGSQLWKHANHIDPASEKNKVKFFLWNNMGLIVSVFAFLPFIILILKDKDKLDKKTKTIALVAGIVALVIGGLTSVDYNPVSQESKEEAIETIDGNVYWTQFGKVYHIDTDCQHIADKDYYPGTVEEAIDNNRTRLCKTCASKNGIDIDDVEN